MSCRACGRRATVFVRDEPMCSTHAVASLDGDHDRTTDGDLAAGESSAEDGGNDTPDDDGAASDHAAE